MVAPRTLEKRGIKFRAREAFENETTWFDDTGAIRPEKNHWPVFGLEVQGQHLLERNRHVRGGREWDMPGLRIVAHERGGPGIEHQIRTHRDWCELSLECERSLIDSLEIYAFGCKSFDHQLLGSCKTPAAR